MQKTGVATDGWAGAGRSEVKTTLVTLIVRVLILDQTV